MGLLLSIFTNQIVACSNHAAEIIGENKSDEEIKSNIIMFGVWWAFCNDAQIEFWIYVTEMISYSRVRPSPLRKEQDWTRESGRNQAYLVTISEVLKYRQKTDCRVSDKLQHNNKQTVSRIFLDILTSLKVPFYKEVFQIPCSNLQLDTNLRCDLKGKYKHHFHFHFCYHFS